MKLIIFISFLIFARVIKSQTLERDYNLEYIGGDEALYNLIGVNVKYPQYALKNCISGMVFVRFHVNPQGTLDSVYVVKGVHESLDQEAIRVIKLTSGSWKFESLNDSVKEGTSTIPIHFERTCADRR